MPSLGQEERIPGYYPTGEEVELLGGESREMYRRANGGISIGGPDAGSLTASGLWHQDPEPTDSFYERHEKFFGPLDSLLGWLAPREVLMMEGDEPRRNRLYGYADPGFPLTRDFNPDLASAKLGPLYLDLISLSGTLLYSDYDGANPPDDDDGWLSSIDLYFRGGAQITENLFVSLSGAVYYLPFDSEVGFYFANGRPSFFRIAYEGSLGDWNYVLFDEFEVHHRLSEIFDEIEHDEIDKAGRYRFGRVDIYNGGDYFDEDAVYFLNRLGAAANGPLSEDWDAAVSFEHYDFWDTLDFEHLRNWDRFKARIDYTGFDWPVVPYFEYQLTALDDWDILHHQLWLGARARITENLRAEAKVGYFVATGGNQDHQSPLAELGLVHELGMSTAHSLYAGVTKRIWDDSENLLASYIRYTITHRFGSRLHAKAFAQYADLDNLDGDTLDRDGWTLGTTLTAYLSEYTRADAGVHYNAYDYKDSSISELNRLIVRASLSQRILPYLYGRILYQYEDYAPENAEGFDEHLYMLTLTHPF